MKINTGYLVAFFVVLLIEIYIALFVRDQIIRPYIGDVLVVILLYFFIMAGLKKHFRWLPVAIFFFAVAVEISQYLNLAVRLGLADTPIISTMLGATFDPADILCYLAGCFLLTLYQELYVFSKN